METLLFILVMFSCFIINLNLCGDDLRLQDLAVDEWFWLLFVSVIFPFSFLAWGIFLYTRNKH